MLNGIVVEKQTSLAALAKMTTGMGENRILVLVNIDGWMDGWQTDHITPRRLFALFKRESKQEDLLVKNV